jgi:hypothetical protein
MLARRFDSTVGSNDVITNVGCGASFQAGNAFVVRHACAFSHVCCAPVVPLVVR